MGERVSQQTRIRTALDALRSEYPGRPLTPTGRKQYAAKLLAEPWTFRTFYRTFPNPRWKGTELDTLHELSYYLTPRAVWARARKGGEQWGRRETAWTLLALVQHKLGVKAARALRQAFVANGVKYRPRRMISTEQREVLRVRFLKPKRAPRTVTTVPGRRRITFEDP